MWQNYYYFNVYTNIATESLFIYNYLAVEYAHHRSQNQFSFDSIYSDFG